MKKQLVMFVLVISVALSLCIGNALAANLNIDINCTMKPGGSEEAAIKKFNDAVQEARAYGTQIEDQKDAFYESELKKNGMQFITPDNKAIRTQALPAIQRAVGKLAPEVSAEVERLTQ